MGPRKELDHARHLVHGRNAIESSRLDQPAAPCSEPSRYGLAMMGARGNIGATANLDSPCARQRLGFVGRGEETGSRSNKETDEEK